MKFKLLTPAARFRLLRRVMRTRKLAQTHALPLCDSDRLLRMTDGDLHAYFFNLGDRIKRHIMAQEPAIARRWKFPDAMAPWEFAKWFDVLRGYPHGEISPSAAIRASKHGVIDREEAEAVEL
jgi:hypothetical protein